MSEVRVLALKNINKGDFKPSLNYFQDFLSLSCAGDYLNLGVLPGKRAAKELSEQMAAYSGIAHISNDISLKDSNIHLYSIGDGCKPRCAALFAMRTSWQCYSIDPLLVDAKKYEDLVKRLKVIPCLVEEFKQESIPDIAIIVCVHSHASLTAILESIKANKKIILLSIPCCVPHNIDRIKPDYQYEDWGILSAKKKVKIWIFDKEIDNG